MEPVILPPWIHKAEEVDAEKQLFRLFFYLHKELHLSYDDLMKMPVPAILAMADELVAYSKEQERELKKRKR